MQARKWIITLTLVAAVAADAQMSTLVQQARLVVKNIDGQTLTLGTQDLAKLPQLKTNAKDHDGKTNEYTGVRLRDVLTQAGIVTGMALRGKDMADYVVVDAADGYRVVFSLAELDPDIANTQVIIAESMNGQPLGPKEGPLRLVVPED